MLPTFKEMVQATREAHPELFTTKTQEKLTILEIKRQYKLYNGAMKSMKRQRVN